MTISKCLQYMHLDFRVKPENDRKDTFGTSPLNKNFDAILGKVFITLFTLYSNCFSKTEMICAQFVINFQKNQENPAFSLSFVAGGDVQLCSVFCDCPSCDFYSFFCKDVCYFLVGKSFFAGFLRFQDIFNFKFYAVC